MQQLTKKEKQMWKVFPDIPMLSALQQSIECYFILYKFILNLT